MNDKDKIIAKLKEENEYTGALGFIGVFLCKKLLETNDNQIIGVEKSGPRITTHSPLTKLAQYRPPIYVYI